MNSRDKILRVAMRLFAEKGYAGLSMRTLANALGMSVAAIYHHFPDKGELYLAAVRYGFAGKELLFNQIWELQISPAEKLARVIQSLVNIMLQDPDFHRLIQREIMDADPVRLQQLAQGVFKEQFCQLMNFITELAPQQNACLVATSIIGMVKNAIEHQPFHRYLPGWQPDYEQPEILAQHMTGLLLNGLLHTQADL